MPAKPTAETGTSGDPGTTSATETGATDDLHWTLEETIDPTRYTNLFRLSTKLSGVDNFKAYLVQMQNILGSVELFEYCEGLVTRPDSTNKIAFSRFKRANALVLSILTANMDTNIVSEVSDIHDARRLWLELHRLYAGQTSTDWTLTIANLVRTQYHDGDDVLEHIARMKSFRRDLVLMGRDIADDMFAAFLRLSMPEAWNFVFTGLPDQYGSVEVERRIRDHWSIRKNQESAQVNMAQQGRGGRDRDRRHDGNHRGRKDSMSSSCSRSCKHRPPRPGEPYCTNCHCVGHWVAGCWSKGGGAYGKGPHQRHSKHGLSRSRSRSHGHRSRSRDRQRHRNAANVAREDSGSESQGTHSSYLAITSDQPLDVQQRNVPETSAATTSNPHASSLAPQYVVTSVTPRDFRRSHC